MIRIRGNSDVTILPNVNTSQCILTVVEAKCKVSFDVPNSLASVLGFKRSIYCVGRHASENHVIMEARERGSGGAVERWSGEHVFNVVTIIL